MSAPVAAEYVGTSTDELGDLVELRRTDGGPVPPAIDVGTAVVVLAGPEIAGKPAAVYALEAVAEYDWLMCRIRHLTVEIAELDCPREAAPYSGASCYAEAKERLEDERAGIRPDGPRRGEWVTLDEIGEAVTDCPACSRLVGLIRDRKEARKALGIVRRQLRHAGRVARGMA